MEHMHTPGPWDMDERNCGGGVIITDNMGRRVCRTAEYFQVDGRLIPPNEAILGNEAAANARLIASAPDLLRVLGECIRQIEGYEQRTGVPQFGNWINDARAILAKIKS